MTPRRLAVPTAVLALIVLVVVSNADAARAGSLLDRARKGINRAQQAANGAQAQVNGTLSQANGIVASADSTVTTVRDTKNAITGGGTAAPAPSAPAPAPAAATRPATPAATPPAANAPAHVNAVAPAVHPHLLLTPIQAHVGATVQLRCVVTDPAGRPLANVPVSFSVRDALPWHAIGAVAYSNAQGVAAVPYIMDFVFNPNSRLTTIRSRYSAKVEASEGFIPSMAYGTLTALR